MNCSRRPAACPLLIERPPRRFMHSVVILFSSLLALAHASPAQTEVASVSGTIVDRSGGLVPSVQVTVINTDTNEKYETKTNNAGVYNVPSVKPGHFRILVTKPGFKQIDLRDVTLNVQDSVNRNFTLDLGGVSETVIVNAGDRLNINTTDASVSTVVDRQFVANMPLNGRSFQDLLTLVPGVSAVPGVAPGGGVGGSGQISVNGQRTEANYFTVDGVSANTGTTATTFGIGPGYAGTLGSGTALGTTQSLVSVDALQEFRATTSTYSAEYGRTPGGQFSFVTRSGSNDWHGSAFDYLRNDAMDANNWFNNFLGAPKTAERQNDFGGTLGGPILIPGLYNGKDRTFFFFSYEGLRLLQPQAAALVVVPDATLRRNAPAALQPILNAFPLQTSSLPNGGEDGLNDGFAFYREAISNPSSLDSISVRIDHNLNGKFKIFGRYADTPSYSASYSATKDTTSLGVRGVTFGATNLITSNQSSEFRFNITQTHTDGTSVSTNLGGATPLDLNSFPGPGGVGFPARAAFLGVCLCYGSSPTIGPAQQETIQRQYGVTEAYSWAIGRHTLKFGVDWRRLASKATPVNPLVFFVYFDQASILANNAGSVQALSESPSAIEPVYTNFSAFVQDNWKVSPRLSLGLGVRWDVNPAPGNAIGPRPYTVTQVTNLATTQVAPAGTPLWKTSWNNFAPRLGAAYQLRHSAGHETVLRGGFGLFYDMGNTNGSQGFNNGVGFASTVIYSGVSFPLTTAQLQVPPPSITPPYNAFVIGFDPNLTLPYTLQWNVALEQALGSKQSITLSYIGSAGLRLLTQFQYRPANLGNLNFKPTSPLYVTLNSATSDYHALQVQYEKRLGQGLQGLASYTWSHSIDDASSNFTVFELLLRASSDFDIRNNFQAALTYDVPGSYSNSVLSAILKHWGVDARISARSALPVDVLNRSVATDPATQQRRFFHPILVAGQPLYVFGSQYPGGRAINFNAFTPAPAGTEGNTPRNFARGFNAVQASLTLRREFPIRDRLRLQFRAEAFNLLNHPLFGSVNNRLSAGPSVFGRAFNTLNNVPGSLSPLYQGGGPRSLQIALRLSF